MPQNTTLQYKSIIIDTQVAYLGCRTEGNNLLWAYHALCLIYLAFSLGVPTSDKSQPRRSGGVDPTRKALLYLPLMVRTSV